MDAARKDDRRAPSNAESRLDELAREEKSGIISEFREFLRENKKWWLAPILIVLLVVGVLVVLGSTGLAPFIYTLF